jgi:hypothetical protein
MTAKRKLGPAYQLAEAVTRRREELGLTWTEFREQYGINQSVVNRWKTNPDHPNLAKDGRLQVLAELLGLTFDEVRALAGTGEPKRRRRHVFTPDELEALVDEAEGQGWEVIKSRVIRRMAREDTDQ